MRSEKVHLNFNLLFIQSTYKHVYGSFLCFLILSFFLPGDKTMCASLSCTYGCKPSPKGPLCYCGEGKEPNGNECISKYFENSCSVLKSNL